jgi:hypothetical protein
MFYNMFLFCFILSYPFYVNMSSKAALSVLATAVSNGKTIVIVFHKDCTFKCNYNEFSVLVFGVTDAQQQLHVLSMSVVSHHSESIYSDILDTFN